MQSSMNWTEMAMEALSRANMTRSSFEHPNAKMVAIHPAHIVIVI
jgi:hypothetical protein